MRGATVTVGLAGLLAVGLLAACDPSSDSATAEQPSVVSAKPQGVRAAAGDPVVAASRFLLSSAPAVVLVPAGSTVADLAPAAALGIPALPDTRAGQAEAERLGARVLDADDPDLGRLRVTQRTDRATLAITTEPSPLMRHLAAVTGARLVRIARDPRADRASIRALRPLADAPVLAIGAARYPVEVVTSGATVAAGGYLALPGHHYLAMYGHPLTAALGVLGEQNPRRSVERVRQLVRKYERAAPRTSFAPAFEIIATVATAGKGPRGDYSARTSLRDLRPLVDAARRAGVTVILDLQPGRASLLEQARHYRSLLAQPHVGLAIDPEWKLSGSGKPLQRIGHVQVREINRVSSWLARLTRNRVLPQKLFVVHQFQTQMVRDRQRLVTRRPELATVIHVDGQGPPAAKFGTWHTVRADAPAGAHWGWKNFVDEDDPMLDAAQTWRRVRPHPALVTYQ